MMKLMVSILTAICPRILFFRYSKTATVSYYRHIDLSGIHNIKLKYPFTPDTTRQEYAFKVYRDMDGRIIIIEFPEDGGSGKDPHDHYRYMKISYSKKREIWRYYNANKKPMMTLDEIYGIEYRLDNRGFPILMRYLDFFGRTAEYQTRIVAYALTTDEKGYVTDCLRLNRDGAFVVDFRGNYRTHYTYDDRGFEIEYANYNNKGSLAALSSGIAIIRRQYNSNGDLIEVRFFNTNNEPQSHKKGSTTSEKYFYDDFGNHIETRKYNKFGELISN